MIPLFPSSVSPSAKPVLRKATVSRSCVSTVSCRTKNSVTFLEDYNSTHDTLPLYEYSSAEVNDCWWCRDKLSDIQDDAQAEAKLLMKEHSIKANSASIMTRGYERFICVSRKRAMVEMAREAVLYDDCVGNYVTNSNVALREAQVRAALDASVVDRTELARLMKQLPRKEEAAMASNTKDGVSTFQTRLDILWKRRARPAPEARCA
jgi:hypothetical protein